MMKLSHLEAIQSLAIVGATGAVGQEFISLLEEHKIKIGQLKLLASGGSAGETVAVGDSQWIVEALSDTSFEGVEAAFFSLPNRITERYVPIAVDSGCLVVDDSCVYRNEPGVPLVIPEINGHLLKDFEGRIISTPNCSVTPVALCLKPLRDRYTIKRVVISTYQSVSGAGREAVEELSSQTAALLNGKTTTTKVFAHRIAFNCLPVVGATADGSDSEEETKIIKELRKILDLPKLLVSASCVRVPTFCGHGASVNIEFEGELGPVDTIRESIDSMPGVRVLDKPSEYIYATGVEATGSDLVFVSRIRRDYSAKSALNLWVVADNLRKGASLNALQILDTLYTYRRMS